MSFPWFLALLAAQKSRDRNILINTIDGAIAGAYDITAEIPGPFASIIIKDMLAKNKANYLVFI